jgi:hypothetical protein
MDKLEEYIRKNRENLDKYNPPSGTWKKIRRDLREEKTRINRFISVAAMFVVILGTALVMFRLGKGLSENQNGNSSKTGLSTDNSHLRETEIYYNNLVNSLYREATPLLTGNPEIRKELNNDISQLDSICYEIKRDLKDNIANQEVVEALIQNYRIKIRLLEDMLVILKENENNSEKNDSHEL